MISSVSGVGGGANSAHSLTLSLSFVGLFVLLTGERKDARSQELVVSCVASTSVFGSKVKDEVHEGPDFRFILFSIVYSSAFMPLALFVCLLRVKKIK